jgi:hypothetical protein
VSDLLLNALKRNLVNLTGVDAAVTQARIDAIENPQAPEPEPEPVVSVETPDDSSSFDGPDPYPPTAGLSRLLKADLVDLAYDVGIDVEGKTKAELVEALEPIFEEE